MKLKEFIRTVTHNREKEELTIFIDIENYKYNCKQGRQKPTLYKACIYSLQVGFYYKNKLYMENFYDFKTFFDDIINNYSKYDRKQITLIAHNGNKYDYHYLNHALIKDYDCIVYNEYLTNAVENNNPMVRTEFFQKQAPDIKVLTDEDKKACILERRVKSKSNLSMTFFLNGIKFVTDDSFLKTNMSLDGLSNKLYNHGILTEKEKKGTMDYTKYDIDEDMTYTQAKEYAKQINARLSPEDMDYIKNDIIVLANAYTHYEDIYPQGFSFDRMTLTQNIQKYYTGDGKGKSLPTEWQLLQRLQQYPNVNIHLKNSEYQFDGENYYHYLKHFYSGGLNLYNDKFLGKIINRPIFSIDINSSYPYVMYSQKVPTFLVEYKDNDGLFSMEPDYDENYFYLYKVPKLFLSKKIEEIPSTVNQEMMVKYYQTIDNYSYINTNTLRIFKDIFKVEFKSLLVQSYVKYNCQPFAARRHIAELYGRKEQGGSDRTLITKDPLNIRRTKHINKNKISKEERNNDKVLLNGLYGIPALRANFNLFRTTGTSYLNYENGYRNSERNIIFSIFVTSYALYNLLLPFKDLAPHQIDQYFLYCDTDSLYFINDYDFILKDIDKSLIHDHNLGKFSFDSKTITNFIILNHKKYAYMDNGKITVKCGGVPLEAFKTDYKDFNQFILNEYYPTRKVPSKSHILSNQGTMIIYDSVTKLDLGVENQRKLYDPEVKDAIISIFDQVNNLTYEQKQNIEYHNAIYVESPLGAFSIADIQDYKLSTKATNEKPLSEFIKEQQKIINYLTIK